MKFRILGSLQVCDGDREVGIRGGKQAALLAILLLQPNRSSSEDLLIEALWGDGATARSADNLHVLVSRLRRLLGADRVLREGSGYRIRVDDGELDAVRFERLRAEGRPREALELWRGDALADFAYETWAQNEIRRLEELRLATLEERIEQDLAAGVDGELVGELQALVASHPLREALRRHLIVALYRSERQAEALEAYRDARRMLDEELGLEPSPALRALEGAVLRHDPSLDRPQAEPTEPARRRRRAALAGAVAALLAGFAAAIGAIQLLDGDEAKRVAAATGPTTGSTESRSTRTSTARKIVVRQKEGPRGTSTPRPPAPRTAVRRSPPSAPSPPPAPASPPPAAPKKKTTPQPQPQPKPQPQPQPQPSPPPSAPTTVELADNFDDNVFNREVWHRLATTGTAAEERNGRVEITIAANAPAEGDFNQIAASYGTSCRFQGDFDARVEYELLEWPVKNGVVLSFSAWFISGPQVSVVRQSQSWSNEDYGSWLGNRVESSPSSDLRGALRIRRVGTTITTFYRRPAGDWHAFQAQGGFSGAPMFGLIAFSRDDWFADKPVRVAFDNFSLTAGERVC